ncbi:MAG: DUF2237 domain-containing protein [Deltaproteobacteria bacterium]|nr:DUF2237 domain-containing protein [Deltaproteobacteria bacterium]
MRFAHRTPVRSIPLLAVAILAISCASSEPKATPTPDQTASACAAEPGTTCGPEPIHQARGDEQGQNILGETLAVCGTEPMTGYYRDGRCMTGADDRGVHVVCAEMTAEFLSFTKARGNDLSTPRPEYRFAGLKPGDRWCLCASRWREAHEAGLAPPVVVEATHLRALDFATARSLQTAATK